MRIYDGAFYFITFFLIGIFLLSLKVSFPTVLLGTALIAVLFLFVGYLENNKKFFWLAGLSLFVAVGGFYYVFYDNYTWVSVNIPFDKKVNFAGVVSAYPQYGQSQQLEIDLKEPYAGKVLVKLQSYPEFKYGDLVKLNGIIKRPEVGTYADYLAKEGISGTASFPKADLANSNQGNKIKSFLFGVKNETIAVFQKTLPPEKAAFLGGITLGERAEFSKEFKDAMSKSGTTHLVALSGYNITIIAIVVTSFFGYFVKRRYVFWISVFIIVLFVLMTGAEASSVRAAVMGTIALLAKQMGRIHSVRNAVASAAFIMVLFSPHVLRFDVGFQLSFAALLGIVYIGPVIKKFFKVKEEEGFLGWRENLVTTTSAQLGVIPILLTSFGSFSPISILTNVLILEVIPPTMFLGFLMGFVGFIWLVPALILGWFTNLFLSYELFLIDIFSKVPFSIRGIGFYGVIIYYSIIVLFIFYVSRRKTDYRY